MFYNETSVPEVVKNLHKPEWVTPVDDVYTVLKELRQSVEGMKY